MCNDQQPLEVCQQEEILASPSGGSTAQGPADLAATAGFTGPIRVALGLSPRKVGRPARTGETLRANSGGVRNAALSRGTLSKAMASLTMSVRRVGLSTMKSMSEASEARLGYVARDVATAGRSAI